MWLRLQSLLMVILLIGSSIAQTFQYSRGWTNGKRSFSVPQAACQLHRLKAMLQGKPIPPSYFLCELLRVPEGNLKLENLDATPLKSSDPEDDIEK